MIKYALSAAVAALALGAPMAEAQTTQPMPLTNPANPVMSNTSAATTVTAQPQAGADNAFGLGQPVLQQPDMVPMGAVPVPGLARFGSPRPLRLEPGRPKLCLDRRPIHPSAASGGAMARRPLAGNAEFVDLDRRSLELMAKAIAQGLRLRGPARSTVWISS